MLHTSCYDHVFIWLVTREPKIKLVTVLQSIQYMIHPWFLSLLNRVINAIFCFEMKFRVIFCFLEFHLNWFRFLIQMKNNKNWSSKFVSKLNIFVIQQKKNCSQLSLDWFNSNSNRNQDWSDFTVSSMQIGFVFVVQLLFKKKNKKRWN